MNDLWVWLVWMGGAYLIGAVPFGLLIGLAHGVDIRERGSGNIGASNLGRALGRVWGLVCFVLDLGKGLAPVAAYGAFGPADAGGGAAATLLWTAVGAAAVMGHVFPVWLKFRGGKGVATGLGVVLGFWPVLTIAGVIALLFWLVVIKVTGYVSLASVSAALSLPATVLVVSWLMGVDSGRMLVFVSVTALLAALVLVRHRGNLARLRTGEETKAAWARKSGPPPAADQPSSRS